MRKLLMSSVLAISVCSLPAWAQLTPQEHTVTESQPGQVTKTRNTRAAAAVKAIDKPTRRLTLKLPNGNEMDVVAGEEVRNFDQIKLNDQVVVEYVQSLSLTLQKVRTDNPAISSEAAAVRANPGEKPGAAMAQSITAIAEVVDVNPGNSTITLKGPEGRVVELAVKNPDQFKVVKVGDQVQVTYTEAVAISVQTAAAASPQK